MELLLPVAWSSLAPPSWHTGSRMWCKWPCDRLNNHVVNFKQLISSDRTYSFCTIACKWLRVLEHWSSWLAFCRWTFLDLRKCILDWESMLVISRAFRDLLALWLSQQLPHAILFCYCQYWSRVTLIVDSSTLRE